MESSSSFTASVSARASDESTKPVVEDGAIELQMYNNAVGDMSRCIIADVSAVDGDGCNEKDRKDMKRMGKQQEFKRVFKQFSLLSFTCICMSTWEFLLLDNNTILSDGGRAGLFWSYVWALVGYGCICASLAEMASILPISGGQFYWTSEFAPRSCQRFLSYMVGWMSTWTWQTGNASGVFVSGQLIQALITLYYPNYDNPAWQSLLLTLPCISLSLIWNIWGVRYLPMLQNFLMVTHVAGFVVFIAIFWVLAPHVPTNDALLNFTNNGGWKTIGLALMVGQVDTQVCLADADAAVYMAEEVQDAGLNVPKAIMNSFYINGIMGLLMILTYAFCIPSVEDATNHPTGLSLLYVLTLSLPDGGIVWIISMMTVFVFLGNVAYIAPVARETFAFARDNGLPYSKWISKVNKSVNAPVNSVVLTTTVTILFTFLYLASTAAFDSITSLTTVTQQATYIISISCILWRRITLPSTLPTARWSLGRWGPYINLAAILYCCLTFFWAFWPGRTDLTAADFNSAPVMFVVAFFIALVAYYYQGRKQYVGPVVSSRQAQSL